jgi:hypothetical protein
MNDHNCSSFKLGQLITRASFCLWLGVACQFVAVADELSLFVYPSEASVDYSSPSSFTRSLIRNIDQRDEFILGSVHFKISCGVFGQDPVFDFHGGITQIDALELLRQVRDYERGFGAAFIGFESDMLSEGKAEKQFELRKQSGKMSFISFAINRPTCLRLRNYIESYVSGGYAKTVGLTHRPLFREGGSSTAFSVSLVQVAGLLFREFTSKWQRVVYFPRELVGWPVVSQRVQYHRLQSNNYGVGWAEAEPDHIPAVFWDAELIHRWVHEILAGSSWHPNLPIFPSRTGGVPGLVVDATEVTTPEGPFWER